MHMGPAEVEQDTLLSCFSPHAVNKHPFLFSAMFFHISLLFVGDFAI